MSLLILLFIVSGVTKLEGRVAALEGGGSVTKATPPAKDNDDDFDLFGSDCSEEELVKPVAPVKKPKSECVCVCV